VNRHNAKKKKKAVFHLFIHHVICSMIKFSMIVTSDSDYGISRYNRLPWYFSEDKDFFNRITANNICIMGANTAKDFREPLKDIDNIVISSKDNFHPGFIIVRSLEAALKKAKELNSWDRSILVIGGMTLFCAALKSDNLDKIYYTHIGKSFKCDKFISSLLDRADMIYTILDRKIVETTDTINAVNILGPSTLTFYEITYK